MFDLLNIKSPEFLKQLNIQELNALRDDIRAFLLSKISQTGGHLASNLGSIEATIAMHYVFNSPEDKILFDVGHQAYTHKILTGRANGFDNLRQIDGVSGFIDSSESIHDIWESGHSSSSISAALGFLEAKIKGRVIVFIGDASISSGLAFEGLNLLGAKKEYNPIIILNDNKMGISETVGALANFLNSKKHIKKHVFSKFAHKLRKVKNNIFNNHNLFEELGYDYYGIYDGNNIDVMIKILKQIKNNNHPTLLHIKTIKGYGYEPAILHQETYHGLGKFDIETGDIVPNQNSSLNQIITKHLIELRKDKEFYIINPAMISSQELNLFKEKYPQSIIDVGIAEEHAVVEASAMALAKKKVMVLLYSTFMQRAYDQILNDCSRQNLNVFFMIDRAGIVGEDGKTHQGIYDLSMLRSMPNMVIMTGSTAGEIKGLIKYGLNYDLGPIALRYPKCYIEDSKELDIIDMSWVIEQKGNKAVIISYGPDIERIKKLGLDAYIINARFLRPLDKKMLDFIAKLNLPILIYEQVVEASSLMEAILAYYHKKDIKINKLRALNIGNNQVIAHGKLEDVLEKYHLDDKSIIEAYEDLVCD